MVDDLDLVPEHFASVDTICAYLRSRIGEGAGQAGAPWMKRPRRQPPRAWGGLAGLVGRGPSSSDGWYAKLRDLYTGW